MGAEACGAACGGGVDEGFGAGGGEGVGVVGAFGVVRGEVS